MLTPPRSDLVQLAIDLVACGAIAVLGGATLIWLLEQRPGLSLSARFVLVTLVGNLVLVVTILLLARLMFISTHHDLQVLIATALFGGVVSVAFTTLAATHTIGRIGQVSSGIRALAEGSRSVAVDVGGRDEIAALADDVGVLSRRLAEADAQRIALDRERRELTASISHDLRTPLSSIRAMLDALEDGVVSEPAETRRYFVTIRRDIERLTRMIDDLFELAQMDSGVMQLQRQRVTVHEIVSEVVDAMRAQADRSGISMALSVDVPPPPALLDGDRLERAIANLLRNALEHTPAGGEVNVSVTSSDGRAVVRVSDTGEGIDDKDLPHVWTRFYRAEPSRARSRGVSDGVGLGLAITKGIVEQHGGTVAVRSTRGAGSSFTVSLPLDGG